MREGREEGKFYSSQKALNHIEYIGFVELIENLILDIEKHKEIVNVNGEMITF